MLQQLHIKNLALIENLRLPFQSGFTTLTGETGAGKSILLDALGLTLGNRADASLVRHGAPKADIIAEFDLTELPEIRGWLLENDLENEEDENSCLIRRTVTAEGRSKAYINGIAVPVAQLKQLGALLIDIHGQHEHQSLMQTAQQMILLDAYAQNQELLKQTQTAYQNWQMQRKTLEERQAQLQEQQDRLELLQFQKNEFDKINPQPEEFATLSEEQHALSHANDILQGTLNAYQALEGEDAPSAVEAVQQAIGALEDIIDYQPALSVQLEQLNSALIELQEAASDIRHASQTIELDPARLQFVEDRLAELHGLAKKYAIEPEALLEKKQQIEDDLNTITHADEEIESLKEAVEQAKSDFDAVATQLSQQRQQAAQQLSQQVTDSMQTLGMANGQFSIELQPAEAPSANGVDKVQFLVTANAGQPLKPLTKVASGGELSRISLSIQVATAEVASLPTLIFDEVDVGIGGGIAEIVGQKMRQLGESRQILSITHLAQVAAHGHQHLQVAKQSDGTTTTTAVQPLDDKQRIEELARMLGGMKITEQTLKHAEEMLKHAQKA